MIPTKLKEGDEIRILSPAESMSQFPKKFIDDSKEKLERLGFEVYQHSGLREMTGCLGGIGGINCNRLVFDAEVFRLNDLGLIMNELVRIEDISGFFKSQGRTFDVINIRDRLADFRSAEPQLMIYELYINVSSVFLFFLILIAK